MVAACSGPAPPQDTVLRCSAAEIQHVFRIPPDHQRVEDVSATPAKVGQLSVTDSSYVLRFEESRDHYELIVVIDRSTGRGTRTLYDDEQQVIHGHGGLDEIVCTPDGQPL